MSIRSCKLPHGCLVPAQISPYVSELSLYDIAGTPGVATDISHINSRAKATVSTAVGAHHQARLQLRTSFCTVCYLLPIDRRGACIARHSPSCFTSALQA